MSDTYLCPQCGAEYDAPGVCEACNIKLVADDENEEMYGFSTNANGDDDKDEEGAVDGEEKDDEDEDVIGLPSDDEAEEELEDIEDEEDSFEDENNY